MNYYSKETRQKALAMRRAGETRAHVARVLGIDASTLKRWEKQDEGAKPLKNITSEAIASLSEGELPELTGALSKVLSEELPRGNALEFYKATAIVKLAAMVQKASVPQITKMSDLRVAMNLMNSLFELGSPKRAPGSPSVVVRFDQLSKGPSYTVDAEVVADAEEKDEEIP